MSARTSPTVARSRSLGGFTRRGASNLTARLEENIVPVLLLAAIVVAAVIAWLVGDRYEAFAAADGWHTFFRNGALMGTLFLGALLCVAWVTAHAYMHADNTIRMALLALFVGIAVLAGFSLWLYFKETPDARLAFWLLLVAVVGVLVHTYLVWMHAKVMGVVGMLPLIVVGVYLLWRVGKTTF
jgi:hypothetical protein